MLHRNPKTLYLEGDLGDNSVFGADWIPDYSCPLVGACKEGWKQGTFGIELIECYERCWGR